MISTFNAEELQQECVIKKGEEDWRKIYKEGACNGLCTSASYN
jgi:hypothetical protein